MDTQLNSVWSPDRPEMTLRPHGRSKNQHNGFGTLFCLKTSLAGLTRSRFRIADRLTNFRPGSPLPSGMGMNGRPRMLK